jgi:hypothetical protein
MALRKVPSFEDEIASLITSHVDSEDPGAGRARRPVGGLHNTVHGSLLVGHHHAGGLEAPPAHISTAATL